MCRGTSLHLSSFWEDQHDSLPWQEGQPRVVPHTGKLNFLLLCCSTKFFIYLFFKETPWQYLSPKFFLQTGHLVHKASNKCLDRAFKESMDDVVVADCANSITQQWWFDHYNTQWAKDWRSWSAAANSGWCINCIITSTVNQQVVTVHWEASQRRQQAVVSTVCLFQVPTVCIS